MRALCRVEGVSAPRERAAEQLLGPTEVAAVDGAFAARLAARLRERVASAAALAARARRRRSPTPALPFSVRLASVSTSPGTSSASEGAIAAPPRSSRRPGRIALAKREPAEPAERLGLRAWIRARLAARARRGRGRCRARPSGARRPPRRARREEDARGRRRGEVSSSAESFAAILRSSWSDATRCRLRAGDVGRRAARERELALAEPRGDARLLQPAARRRRRRRHASGSEMESSLVSTVRCLQENSSITEGGVYADSSPHACVCSACCALAWATLARLARV